MPWSDLHANLAGQIPAKKLEEIVVPTVDFSRYEHLLGGSSLLSNVPCRCETQCTWLDSVFEVQGKEHSASLHSKKKPHPS